MDREKHFVGNENTHESVNSRKESQQCLWAKKVNLEEISSQQVLTKFNRKLFFSK